MLHLSLSFTEVQGVFSFCASSASSLTCFPTLKAPGLPPESPLAEASQHPPGRRGWAPKFGSHEISPGPVTWSAKPSLVETVWLRLGQGGGCVFRWLRAPKPTKMGFGTEKPEVFERKSKMVFIVFIVST